MLVRLGLGIWFLGSMAFAGPVLEAVRLGEVARRITLEGLGREAAVADLLAGGASSPQSAAFWGVFSRLGAENILSRDTTNWAELAQVVLRDSFASQERLIAAVTAARREGTPTLFGATFPGPESRETRPPTVTFPDRDPKITGGLAKKLKELRRTDALSVHAAVHFIDEESFRQFWDFLSRNSMVVGDVSARLGASSARTFELTGLPRAVEGLLRQPGLLWVGLRPPRLPELELFDFEVAPAHAKLEGGFIDTLRAMAPNETLRVVLRFHSTAEVSRRRAELLLSGVSVVDCSERGALVEGTREGILRSAALSFVRNAAPESALRVAELRPSPRPVDEPASLLEPVRFQSVDRRGDIVTVHVEVRSFGGTEPRHFALKVEGNTLRVVRTVPDVLQTVSGAEAEPRWLSILLQARALTPGKYTLRNPPGSELEIP